MAPYSTPLSDNEEDEMVALETAVRDRTSRSPYWGNPAAQTHYLELLERRDFRPEIPQAPRPEDPARKVEVETEMRKGRYGDYYRHGSVMPQEYHSILQREIGAADPSMHARVALRRGGAAIEEAPSDEAAAGLFGRLSESVGFDKLPKMNEATGAQIARDATLAKLHGAKDALLRNVPAEPHEPNLGEKANAVVNGAYSVLPGALDAVRALARGTGLMGSTEFKRFSQEADAIGSGFKKAAPAAREAASAATRHPGDALKLLKQAALELDKRNSLLKYYLAGRLAMGFGTGLGYSASVGRALREVEDRHDAIDALIRGVMGLPEDEPQR
jgi:hypothetical protein